MRFSPALHHGCVLPGGNVLLAPMCVHGCALLLSQLGFPHPMQVSFTPIPRPCSAEAGRSHQQPPLSICVHLFPCLSFPHLLHPPPTAQGLLPRVGVLPGPVSI